MHKFNIGDRVKIIKAQLEGRQAARFNLDMLKLEGEIATITEALAWGGMLCYTLDGLRFTWDERCLRRVRKAKIAPIVEVEPPPAITAGQKKELEKLVADLKEDADKSAGNCSFAVLYKNGGSQIFAQAPCHWNIAGHSVFPRTALLLNIQGHLPYMTKPGRKKKYLRYCEYIMTKGPRANCFIYKGMEDALENGVFMNISRPVEELAGAAVALREGSEYSDKLDIFAMLLDAGCSGNVAYLLSYCVSSTYVWQGFSEGHKSISGCTNAEGIFKFFKEGYYLTKKLKPYSETMRKYDGISRWASREEFAVEKTLDYVVSQMLDVAIDRLGEWGYSPKVTKENLLKAAAALEPLVN